MTLLNQITHGSALPVGTIVMYYGDKYNQLEDWAFCNGENGTPDLRDLFIVCAGRMYLPGETGGQESVTLTPAQIPPHTHNYNAFNAVTDDWRAGGDASPGNSTGGNVVAPTQMNENCGMAHENRPPYFALLYMMKIK